MSAILSIQSWVAYGHVGNTAAVFPLQRLGFEVWAVNTVQFSNHTGYGTWRGVVFDRSAIADVVLGIEERGVFGRCDAILSGYMGDASLGEVVLDAVKRVRAANPQALYCCDPVIGDFGRGVFVRPGIAEFFAKKALAAADIVTPNRFELEHLTGASVGSLAEAVAAAERLRARGPRIVLVTSLEPGSDRIGMLASGPEGAFATETPRLPLHVNGAGDVVAALFLGHYLRGRSLPAALERATAGIFAVLDATHRAGKREIQLVRAQEDLLDPPRRFPVEKV
ncbi:MAG: pyridoxal kinase PdxY [Rhodospirillales bacterium]|nr:pyridoxal kinase PdxY [Rhodospirillales bacterium]